MSQELIDRFQSLRDDKDELERRAIAISTRMETNEHERQQKLTELKEKFGVESLDDARELYKKKQHDFMNKLGELEKKVAEFKDTDA